MLEECLRQYRHNNSDEFVFAYDKEGVDALFKTLIENREYLLDEIRTLEDLVQKYQEKYYKAQYEGHL
jgi:hypothetical protein